MVAPTDANSQPVPTRPSKLPRRLNFDGGVIGRSAGHHPELVVGPASNRLRSHALSQVGSEVAYACVSRFAAIAAIASPELQGAAEIAQGSICTPASGAIGAVVVLQLQRQDRWIRCGHPR